MIFSHDSFCLSCSVSLRRLLFRVKAKATGQLLNARVSKCLSKNEVVTLFLQGHFVMQKGKIPYSPRKYVVRRINQDFFFKITNIPLHKVAHVASSLALRHLMRAMLSQRVKGRYQLLPDRGAKKGRRRPSAASFERNLYYPHRQRAVCLQALTMDVREEPRSALSVKRLEILL